MLIFVLFYILFFLLTICFLKGANMNKTNEEILIEEEIQMEEIQKEYLKRQEKKKRRSLIENY